MTDKVQFELVSPERLLLSTEADLVVVPGSDGDMGIMPNHAPLVSTIRPGLVEVHNGESVDQLIVRGGFAEVNPKGLTLLAEEAYKVSELDRASLESDLKDANEDVADAKDDETRTAAERTRDGIAEILNILDTIAA